MRFPLPWRLEQTGPADFAVLDKDNRKLFYVVADQDGSGEDPDAQPGDLEGPTLLGSDDDADETILNELEELLGRLE